MHLQIYVYTLMIEDEEYEKDETVHWSEHCVIVCNPSQGQCMEVISKISASQDCVILIRLTRNCIEILLPFLLKRRAEETDLMIRDTPMHGLVHLISSQISTSTINSLALIACSIDNDDVIPLAQSLKHNTSLCALSLCSNPGITSESVYALAELLLTNNSLQSLMLGELNFSHFGLSALIESLGKNKNMTLVIDEEYQERCKSMPSYLPVKHRIEFM